MIDEGIRTRAGDTSSGGSWWVLTTAAYAAITSATVAWSQADAIDYIGSIVGELHGGGWEFCEFGHVLWRPLGYITYRVASSVIERLTGSDPTTGVMGSARMELVGRPGGGGCGIDGFVSRLRARPWCIPIVTFAYIVETSASSITHIPGVPIYPAWPVYWSRWRCWSIETTSPGCGYRDRHGNRSGRGGRLLGPVYTW